MNKQELIDAVAELTMLTKKESKAAVDAFLETVTGELSRGGEVSLIGFGRFLVRERQATNGRNPQNGAPMLIPAKRIPSFKPGLPLRESVN